MKNLLCFLILFFVSFTANADENLIQNVPKNWGKEVFTFPLQFAPSIELKGIEEVYFAPGMFKADASDYFNYVFLWHVAGKQQFNSEDYRSLLIEYYKGLYLAVSKATDDVKNEQTKAFDFLHQTSINNRNTFTGNWLDPFNADSPIKLIIEIELSYCEKQDKSNVIFRIVSEGKSSALAALNTMKMPKCEE